MSDLPPELLDRLAHRLNDDWNAYLRTVGRTDLMVPEEWTDNARSFLAALAEWADGALIDPATWTRWDSRQEAIYCSTHGRLHFGHGRRVAAVCPNDAGCSTVPLYTLTPAPEEETSDG